MTVGKPKPLVILTADKDAQFAIQELMRRPEALKIRPVEFDCVAHSGHDSGVYNTAHEFLRPFLKWGHAIVLFDRDGCGHEDQRREVVESAVEDRLAENGWEGRSVAVVIDPELESWVWDDACQVNRLLKWPKGIDDLRRWMTQCEFVAADRSKPARPKEAFRAALRQRKMPVSSALFMDLATSFKFDGCRDAAFQRFLLTLQTWFPMA